jgi:hypothetical protein
MLAIVAGLGALGAFAGAWGLIGGAIVFASGIAERIPFPLWIPAVILGVAVGGTMLLACLAAALNTRFTAELAVLAGAVSMGWISLQVALIGYVSWMQPAVFTQGLIALALGFALRSTRE